MSAREVIRRRVRALVTTLSLLALSLLAVSLPATSDARQSVHLRASLTPERLGGATTIGFELSIAGTRGDVPPPLTAIDLSYPNELGIAVSGLGVETCEQSALETFGLDACPADSRMGYGSATVEIPVGPDILSETAGMAIVRARTQSGLAVLFFVEGATPVQAQIALPALLEPAAPPYGGQVEIDVPLVPSLPEAPDVSLVHLHATLGPQGLVYYESVHGHRSAYRPRGIVLPDACPSKGFPFTAQLTFVNGARQDATTRVPCPRRPR